MPRRPSGPSLPGSPWGPTGPVLPGGPWVPVVPYKAADKTKVDLKKKRKDFDRTHHATQLPLLPSCLASLLFLRCPRDPAADGREVEEMVVTHMSLTSIEANIHTVCRELSSPFYQEVPWDLALRRLLEGPAQSDKKQGRMLRQKFEQKQHFISKEFRHYAEYYVIYINRGLKTSYCFSSFSSVSLGSLYTICSLQVRKSGIN